MPPMHNAPQEKSLYIAFTLEKIILGITFCLKVTAMQPQHPMPQPSKKTDIRI